MNEFNKIVRNKTYFIYKDVSFYRKIIHLILDIDRIFFVKDISLLFVKRLRKISRVGQLFLDMEPFQTCSLPILQRE